MAHIKDSKKLFFVTSPRSPLKMIPEVKLLTDHLSGEKWDIRSQNKFANLLADSSSFRGNAKNDKGFSARDRITRGPKALGFVDLKPTIELTEAGMLFINSDRPSEIFTRQLLKFQLPSQFHKDKANNYHIKPFLEILRLIYDLEYLTKDEIRLFGLRLTDFRKYDLISNEIKVFRENRKNIDRNKSNYKIYRKEVFDEIFKELYKEELNELEGNTKKQKSFTDTTKQTMNDYADACFRYIRATELVTTNRQGNYLIVPEKKKKEVEFILTTIDRDPGKFLSEKEYKEYLYNPSIPVLAIDNRDELSEILIDFGVAKEDIDSKTIRELQDLKHKMTIEKMNENVQRNVVRLKTYDEFNEILEMYKDIKGKNVTDQPLMLEWNTWRAFTMLNDGNIHGNFKVDIEGMPLSTAGGNSADIECEYKDFKLIVEVTMSSGQKQYEMEGEPVARHLGDLKLKNNGKDSYCIFIAPKVSEATLAHFYSLHKINIKRYGGKSKIIPIALDAFIDMLKCANENREKVSSDKLKIYLDTICNKVNDFDDEEQWFMFINKLCKSWI